MRLKSLRVTNYIKSHVFVCYLILERSFKCLSFIGFNAVATLYMALGLRVYIRCRYLLLFSGQLLLRRQFEELNEQRECITLVKVTYSKFSRINYIVDNKVEILHFF